MASGCPRAGLRTPGSACGHQALFQKGLVSVASKKQETLASGGVSPGVLVGVWTGDLGSRAPAPLGVLHPLKQNEHLTVRGLREQVTATALTGRKEYP